MEPVFKNLGKVRPTVDNDNWSIDNEYDLLTIVYDPSSNKSYISRQPVPANVVIDNREYWLPFGVGKFVDNAIININYLDGVSEELVTYTLEEAIVRIGDEDKRLGVIISFYGNESNDSHTPGWCLYQFISSDLNDWNNVDAWNSIYYNRNKNVGWFRTESDLLSIYPNPHKGDYCYIGTSLLGSFVYRCYENSTWVNTNELASANIGIIIDGTITISQNGTWVVDGEDTGIKAVGTGIDRITYTASSADGGTNILQIKLTDGTQFSFPIKNGNQGNSGYQGAAEELEVVNNFIDGGATKALSAEMGKQLKNLTDEGYSWVGVADLNTVAGSFNGKVFYIATTPGTYDVSFGSIELANNEIAFLKYNGSWSKQIIDFATKTQVDQLGQYVDNPEWIKVVTDSNDKILYGVKTDGRFYFGSDCPPQVVDYITAKLKELDDNFMVLLSTKVDKILGYSLIDENYASSKSAEENPEWLEVKVDSEDKVLEGIKLDGTRVENVPIETSSSVIESVSNPKWLKVITDKDGSILEGITKDGEKEWFKGIPTPILNLLYPIVSGDFHSEMSKEQFVNVYNSKITAFCKLCRCNPDCMEELKIADCDSVLYEKINHNFRKEIIKYGMSKKIIASQLNKYFRIPIYRFCDIKLNNTDTINNSLIVPPFASYAYEPSSLISDDGERIELYNASNSRTTSIDGVIWTEAEPLVLNGGRNWASHTSVNKVDGIYMMLGCAGGGDHDTLDLYTSTDGVHFIWKGHLFQANDTIVAKINGVDTICTGWGNSYLIKDNGTYYLYYECLIRGWEICLATCTDLYEDRGDGFIGNWVQCQGNPIIPRTNIDGDPTKPLKPGNPEIVKGEDNRPLKCNGKYYMYYHAMTADDKGPIYRAYSENLVNWVIEGKIFDNRDLPTLPRGTNSDHSMCQFKGRSYLFYTHDINNYEGPNHTADLSAISIREMCDDRPLYKLLDLRA